MRKLIGSISALAACAALGSNADRSRAQAPAAAQTDPWELHKTPESCYLSRHIDSGTRGMDVLIQSFGSASPYHVMVRGPGLPLLPDRAVVAHVGIGDGEPPSKTFVFVGKASNVPVALFAAAPPRPGAIHMMGARYYGTNTDARMGAIVDPAGETLSLAMTGMDPLVLPLGPMEGEYARLDDCAQALENDWRSAASAGAKPVDAPTLRDPNEVSWHMKYPEDLLLNRVSGLVERRMMVDAKGRARNCVVQLSTWGNRLGDASCAHMQQIARFEPAHGAQGNPVNAYFQTSALFIIYNW